MKQSAKKQLLFFYLWLSLGYIAIWVFHDLSGYASEFTERLVNHLWRIPYIAVLNFFYFEYVLPFVTRKRRYLIYNIILFLISFWVLSLFYSFGLHIWRAIGIQLHVYTPIGRFENWGEEVASSASFGFGSFFVFGLIRHTYVYFKLKNDNQKLELEKKQSELNFLKSQTNPHFLFNTLNNIYSLTKFEPELAAESLLRLSKILRFMLYETGLDFIPVSTELKILNDYLDLEKLRYSEELRVNFSHDVEDMAQALPPLLLIPLVENAFKHGVSETRDHRFVDIHLTIRQRQLRFVVKNSTDNSSPDPVKENIGLSNLRRQLELLYKEHKLTISNDANMFTAILQINLSSHV